VVFLQDIIGIAQIQHIGIFQMCKEQGEDYRLRVRIRKAEIIGIGKEEPFDFIFQMNASAISDLSMHRRPHRE